MKTLWLGGAGRSGTTWARGQIGAHPKVHEIRPETNYTPHGSHSIRWQIRMRERYGKARGEGVEWVLEKTPSNVYYARELLEFSGPDSKYLHIKRDREATINSTIRAHYSDGSPRRYPSPGLGKPHHRNEVERLLDFIDTVAQNIVDDLWPDRARIVYVEELDPKEVLAWLGLE